MSGQIPDVVPLLHLRSVEARDPETRGALAQRARHRREFLTEVLDPLVVHHGHLCVLATREPGGVPVHRGRIVRERDVRASHAHGPRPDSHFQEGEPGLARGRECLPRSQNDPGKREERNQGTHQSTHGDLLGMGHRTTATFVNLTSTPRSDSTSRRQTYRPLACATWLQGTECSDDPSRSAGLVAGSDTRFPAGS